MNTQTEMLLELLSDVQAFSPDDQLTEAVISYTEDELSLEDLDWVAAAGQSGYMQFLKKLEDSKNL